MGAPWGPQVPAASSGSPRVHRAPQLGDLARWETHGKLMEKTREKHGKNIGNHGKSYENTGKAGEIHHLSLVT